MKEIDELGKVWLAQIGHVYLTMIVLCLGFNIGEHHAWSHAPNRMHASESVRNLQSTRVCSAVDDSGGTRALPAADKRS